MIREFHQGENGDHRFRLFNLREDIGETKNLAAKHPDLVKELNALISKHIAQTQAVVPVLNPDFEPAKYRPELGGVNKGIVTLKATGADPFLGVGAAQFNGPALITIRARAPKGGKGKVSWANESPEVRSEPFKLETAEWSEIMLDFPATGKLGILRVHLPAKGQTIEVDSITITSKDGKVARTWNF